MKIVATKEEVSDVMISSSTPRFLYNVSTVKWPRAILRENTHTHNETHAVTQHAL